MEPESQYGFQEVLFAALRLRSAQRDERWWPGDQLGKPAEVLRNRCQRELELGAAWPAQSQPAEPQDTLQVRKQHFDTFPVAG
jgi:hypothetical protein